MASFRVSSLFVYPVKSLGGIQLTQVKVTSLGFAYDRHMMLTDENGRFLTQREIPQLCLFTTAFEENGIRITYEGESLFIPFYFDGSETKVQVWEDEMTALLANDLINLWFTKRLGKSCRLVRHAEFTQRKVDSRYALNGEETRFGDAFPVLVIGEESLNFLNTKLEEPLPMNRFRPNLVFSGGQEHREDQWKEIYFADAALRVSKPCARCVMTTINQQTGEKGKEPLHTLATYRQWENKILFGQNALVIKPGVIRVGDELGV